VPRDAPGALDTQRGRSRLARGDDELAQHIDPGAVEILQTDEVNRQGQRLRREQLLEHGADGSVGFGPSQPAGPLEMHGSARRLEPDPIRVAANLHVRRSLWPAAGPW
jgi:hypothetical protein